MHPIKILKGHPTSFPEVNAVLEVLLTQIQAILGDYFTGMYLHGSLANGDFNPGRSDIDFLVVTTGEIPEKVLITLFRMHADITASGIKWADRLEGSYIPLQALYRYDPQVANHPALRINGSFGIDHHASDWIIQRYIIRENGIVMAGPPLKTLIDVVHPDELRRSSWGILHEWWLPMLDDPRRLHSSEYQAYAVLTMCRVLYTLHFGQVASKTVAARWAQETFSGQWDALIEQALAWQHGIQLDKIEETRKMIRFALELSG
jgi:predicted nucleotidyltransferase